MIKSIVEGAAFHVANQYRTENRVRITEADERQITSVVIGNSGVYQLSILLKDGSLRRNAVVRLMNSRSAAIRSRSYLSIIDGHKCKPPLVAAKIECDTGGICAAPLDFLGSGYQIQRSHDLHRVASRQCAALWNTAALARCHRRSVEGKSAVGSRLFRRWKIDAGKAKRNTPFSKTIFIRVKAISDD